MSLPCPLPVAPSEPNSSTLMRAQAPLAPFATSAWANRLAATIGPTVCELDGPMPLLNRSNTLIAMAYSRTDGPERKTRS